MPNKQRHFFSVDAVRDRLAGGEALSDIARDVGCSTHTLRNHLRQVDYIPAQVARDDLPRGKGGDAEFARLMAGRRFTSALVSPARVLLSPPPRDLSRSFSGCAAAVCAEARGE